MLLAENADALWVSSWPLAEYVKHDWPGAWICSCFRNESDHIASELIREAIAATVGEWGKPPSLGMITFINRKKVRFTIVRGVKTWGYCYKKAGFKECGETKGGLLALKLDPCDFPESIQALPYRDNILQRNFLEEIGA